MQLLPQRIRDLSFWHYQIIGWVLYSSVQLAMVLSWKKYQWMILLSIFIQLAVLFILLLILRKYYRTIHFHDLGLLQLVSRMVVASLIITCTWILLWGGIEFLFFGEKFIYSTHLLLYILSKISLSFPIFLGWSALFFGIKLWRDWLNEREQTERAKDAAQRSQLQMLRYQLNPHFLFNALNSVRALIDEDAQHAKTMITELSEFLRYSLVSRNKPVVTLRDELDALRLYLSIEEQRYEDKLQVTYDVDPSTNDIPVPNFLVHPLAEYALRCGMQTSTMPLRLKIQAAMVGDTLKVTVAHSGNELPRHEDRSRNLQESCFEQVEARLKDLFPNRYRLSSVQQNDETLTILELTVTNGVMHEKKIAGNTR